MKIVLQKKISHFTGQLTQIGRFNFFGCGQRLCSSLYQILTEPHWPLFFHFHNTFTFPKFGRLFILFAVVQNNDILFDWIQAKFCVNLLLHILGFFQHFLVAMGYIGKCRGKGKKKNYLIELDL